MSPEEARVQKLEERMNDMVHKAELRELIQQWREEYHGDVADQAYLFCADELEELLND